jgi:hypothetical protein
VGPRRTDIHVLAALSRHPCRSSHSTPPTFSLHQSRALWCLDCRVQEQLWLELTLFAFLVRTSTCRTPSCRSALARDLPGTGSKTCACGVSGIVESPDFATAARQIASKVERHPGRSYGLRPESKAATPSQPRVIISTLRVGMHGKTLCVQVDAERQSMRYHAERGNDQCPDSWLGPPASGFFTSATLRGPAPNGHPCPCGALAASMPLVPLRVVCVWPAPKSRFVVSGLSR